MKIKVTCVYESSHEDEGCDSNSEVVAKVREALLNGDLNICDIMDDETGTSLSVEVIEDLPIAASQSHGIAAK